MKLLAKDFMNQLIINTEYFLQCAGSCSGCFLSLEERQASNNFHENIENSLLNLLNEKIKEFEISQKSLDFLVVGIGRGNNLLLSKEQLKKMGQLIEKIETMFKAHQSKVSSNKAQLVFEISTSLIGKLEKQLENAHYLLNFSKNIYFNIVINSEITSNQFWVNLKTFHSALTKTRQSWGWNDKTGDILVLNINPSILPDISKLDEFAKNISSPINISLFPYDMEKKNISIEEQKNVLQWSHEFLSRFKNRDLNIKNYIGGFKFELSSVQDVQEHIEKTLGTYFFIDKHGKITNGQPSIMGEVDYPRLLDKYQITPQVTKAFSIMQKNKACQNCDYQKYCLASGAYLNMIANHEKMEDKSVCANGYQEFFKDLLKI